MLSSMESSEHPITPAEASAALADADSARTRLARGLRLPSYFNSSIGAAIAVQIVTSAAGIANQETWGLVVLAGGLAVFGLVAGIQLARFRRLNGARVGGLASQVMLGTAGLASSLMYTAAFAVATWAAFAGAWWLTAIAAVAGGAAYAWAGRLWWRRYQGAPAEHSRGEQVVVLVVAVVLALVFLVALVALR